MTLCLTLVALDQPHHSFCDISKALQLQELGTYGLDMQVKHILIRNKKGKTVLCFLGLGARHTKIFLLKRF